MEFVPLIESPGPRFRRMTDWWYDPGDPFGTPVALAVGRGPGELYTGTVLYAAVPVLLVTHDPVSADARGTDPYDTYYTHSFPEHGERMYQGIQALFLEVVVGELLEEGHDNIGEPMIHPFPHSCSVMVYENRADGRSGTYDLYEDLLPECGGEGHDTISFVGNVARTMARHYNWPEPTGF